MSKRKSGIYVPPTYKATVPDLWQEDPPVCVGVISQELARFSGFFQSLLGVMGTLPPGSGLTWAKSVDIPGNCNAIVRHMLAGDWQALWLLGDDHVMDPYLCRQLMMHDVDVIVPHCLKRYPPWPAVVYSHQNEDGWYVTAELPASGLTKIHAAGSAGMLIKRHVLEALEDPWFAPGPGAAGLNEDLEFCRKARNAGFGIYCDPEALLGHISLHTVWPARDDEGEWHLELEMNETERFPIKRMRNDEADATVEAVA